MIKPIIDPSTLSVEQRDAIKAKYNEVKEVSLALFAGDEVIFEWLFGKDFFESSATPLCSAKKGGIDGV